MVGIAIVLALLPGADSIVTLFASAAALGFIEAFLFPAIVEQPKDLV